MRNLVIGKCQPRPADGIAAGVEDRKSAPGRVGKMKIINQASGDNGRGDTTVISVDVPVESDAIPGSYTPEPQQRGRHIRRPGNHRDTRRQARQVGCALRHLADYVAGKFKLRELIDPQTKRFAGLRRPATGFAVHQEIA